MPQSNTTEEISFSNLGLKPKILEALTRLNFVVPTPIQRKAIPIANTGQDLIGVAQTGTGKTLAFVLPMMQQIAQKKKMGLIIVPTRELAMQVEEQLEKIGRFFGMRQVLLIGGAPMPRQLSGIRRHPHVVIGTPGRIIDHLKQGTLKLDNVGILVLDEADRMLDMGFAPQIKQIIERVPRERQTMLFSATIPREILGLASKYMKLPVSVEVAKSGTVAEKIEQELFIVAKDQKNRLLDKLLDTHKGTVLVFSRTKHGAKKVCRAIRQMNHSAAEIHSNLSLSQRRRSLDGFKNGTYRVLVATDIAARGIDVTNIGLVINYDLPDNLDDYVHRIGRTGRAGKTGLAISFVAPEQRSKIRIIERLVRQSLRISPLPSLPAHRPVTHEPEFAEKSYHRSGRQHSSGQRSHSSKDFSRRAANRSHRGAHQSYKERESGFTPSSAPRYHAAHISQRRGSSSDYRPSRPAPSHNPHSKRHNPDGYASGKSHPRRARLHS